MNTYLTQHQMLCKHQSKNHSTITAIEDVPDFMYKTMGKSLQTGTAYVDLHKVFNIVNPLVMIRKLSCVNVKNTE